MALLSISKFEQVTVPAASTALAWPSTFTGVKPTAAEIVVETAPIRYCVDGSTPSATVGTPVEAGGVIPLNDFGELRRFRAFRTTGVSAQLNVSYGTHHIP